MRILKKLIKLGVFLGMVGILFYAGLYVYAHFTPKLSIDSANSLYLYDSNDALFSGAKDEWVSLEDISEYLINATVSIEDKNFFKHIGFDYLRIAKSLYVDIKEQNPLQGASTITQQYAKNLFLTFDKTWERKITEAWLTIRLETHYSKKEILEGYLNTINYGGIFGIGKASYYYFGKSPKDLTLSEASMLAGIPKHPSKFSPIVNEKEAKKRQAIILQAMNNNEYITEGQMIDARNENLEYIGVLPKSNLTTLKYYEEAVLNELQNIKTIPNSFLQTGGLKIYTSLNLEVQTTMEESINKNLEDPELQIASVVMNPQNGEVIALAGGRDYSKSQFNRAMSAKRQVGSTMKPLLYYAALENGFTASTTFKSTKTTFTFAEGKTYSPENYGQIYPDKSITMAAALSFSDNIYAVKTNLFLGEETLVNISKRLGIKSELMAVPSLALGTNEINIMEMMTSYAAFANEGFKVEPHFIKRVEDINGNVLYEYKEEKENILNKSIVFILNNLLKNCYSSEMIDYTYPTCINLAGRMKYDYAIKTGTTNTDSLIFGYNKQMIMGIWTGYDDNRNSAVNLGTNIREIWFETIESTVDESKDHWYEIPNNVVGVLVNPITGELATPDSKKSIFYYIKGTEPTFSNNLDDSIPTVKPE